MFLLAVVWYIEILKPLNDPHFLESEESPSQVLSQLESAKIALG